MSYKVEFDNESEWFDNNHNTIEPYWLELSKLQVKRHKKVLQQMINNWYSVYNTLNTLQNQTIVNTKDVNIIMDKIYRLYFIHSRSNEEYYNQEKIIRRKNNNYLSKKINKFKNKKYKL